MNKTARGQFDIKRSAEPVHEKASGLLGRHSLDKAYRGDLNAAGVGEMLSAGTPTPGSAGYVAIERVTGELNGRKGSFYLQHNGVLNRGEASLQVRVVPDSGADGLAGLRGEMTIDVKDGGAHSYEFAYRLPD